MHTATLYTVCAYAAGLALTLCLCAWLTPRNWWRRPNARALGISALGAWGCGSLLLAALQGAQPALATPIATSATESAFALSAGQAFQVHRDLNVRATAGVNAPRLLTVPAGATVIATGLRAADWWQVTAHVNGNERTGWASSLWLRRAEEHVPPAAEKRPGR
jgi:hypothetical protein